MEFSLTDEKLIQLIKRRKLSEGRIEQYNTVFNELYKLLGKRPEEFIKEGKKEQQPYIDKDGNPKLLELEERKINKYQFIYNDYLEGKNNSENTKAIKLKVLRCLYNEYNIELPKPLKYDIKTQRIRTKDIPSWIDVKNSLKFCKNLRDKAIVTLIATSGIREGDIVRFTIQNFLDATSIYHDGSIEDLLTLNPANIVPCYDFIPQKTSNEGNLCITFNTPEASYYIFEYLKERIAKGYSVEPEDSLFRSKKPPHFLVTDTIQFIFRILNRELKLGDDKNGYYGKFRAHNLRKLFSTTCRKNITNIVVNKDRLSELDVVSIFTGHTPPNMNNSEVYDAVDDEDGPNNYLRKNYQALIPYLTINQNNKNLAIAPKDEISLKKEIIKIRNSIDELLI